MINLSMMDSDNILRPRITVMGVGGAGGNAVNNMIRSQLEGCDFVVANTDAQALANSLAPRKIQLGISQTRGLGAGSKPDVGRSAAEEQMQDIMACLEHTDMVFVTAGMGGGTGTGAAPVIARLAREAGILTVGVVTKPFDFEGQRRKQLAEHGINELQHYVDTLIIIPNQNLFRMANERTTFADAFRMADEVLHCGVRGITDLMVMPGFMNLDFADVKTVMGEMGKAMMGTGEAEGENRALRAAEAAISNPLLEDTSMKGAKGVLINITGGHDLTLFEVDQAANRIREEVDQDAQIKVGSTLSETLDGTIRVSVIATGIEAAVQTVAGSMGGQNAGSHNSGLRSQQAHTQSHTGFAARSHQQPAAANMAANLAAPVAPFTNAHYAMANPPAAAQQVAPAQEVAAAGQATPESELPSEVPVQAMPAQQPSVAPMQRAMTGLRGQQTATGHFVAPRPAELPRQNNQNNNAATQGNQWQPAPRGGQAMPSNQQPASQQQPTATEDRPAANTTKRGGESLFTRITGFGMVRPSTEQQGNPTQQRLNIDGSERPPTNQAEDDDLLDIPAFLRRQTNH